MPDVAISVEGISKRYWLGHRRNQASYLLRDTIVGQLRSLGRNTADMLSGRQIIQGDTLEEYWALRDVCFDVAAGEVLGLIGRNGAGKSTLLKILSRITEPDSGKATIKGRVASLLEVGTGFHPELSGRENIFLNGAILGMSRVEIRARFDEIVSFAGIERFLDTPVKRYSSGMYVRLAFSIAAHLEPEILIVDEVLAVGDAEFQKKCLGKMQSVATKDNRTVLFVSHNMQAVQSLCDRVLLLEEGRVVRQGSAREVVSSYLSDGQTGTGVKEWGMNSAPKKDGVALLAVRLFSNEGLPANLFESDKDVYVELEFELADVPAGTFCVGFDLFDSEGGTVFRTYQTDAPREEWPAARIGRNVWRCKLPKGLLNEGTYYISPRFSIHYVKWLIQEDAVIQFRMRLRHGKSPLWDTMSDGARPGQIAPVLDWSQQGSAVLLDQ